MALRSVYWSAMRSGRRRSSRPLASSTMPIETRISRGRNERRRFIGSLAWAGACRPGTVASAQHSGCRGLPKGTEGSISRATFARIACEDLARRVAQDVAVYRDAAAFEFADPVGGQRAFVEFGQLHDIGRACADQDLVDAGPEA